MTSFSFAHTAGLVTGAVEADRSAGCCVFDEQFAPVSGSCFVIWPSALLSQLTLLLVLYIIGCGTAVPPPVKLSSRGDRRFSLNAIVVRMSFLPRGMRSCTNCYLNELICLFLRGVGGWAASGHSAWGDSAVSALLSLSLLYIPFWGGLQLSRTASGAV